MFLSKVLISLCICAPVAAWRSGDVAAVADDKEDASSSSVSEVAQVEDVLVAGALFSSSYSTAHALTCCQQLLASSATTSATFPSYAMSGKKTSEIC